MSHRTLGQLPQRHSGHLSTSCELLSVSEVLESTPDNVKLSPTLSKDSVFVLANQRRVYGDFQFEWSNCIIIRAPILNQFRRLTPGWVFFLSSLNICYLCI